MKRNFGIATLLLVASLQTSTMAGMFSGGPSTSSGKVTSSTVENQAELTELNTEAPAQAAPVCERGNSVSYNFIKDIARGGVDIEVMDGYVRVSVKKYISACIGGLKIKATEIDNNMVIRFEVKDPEVVSGVSANDSFEKKYLACIEKKLGDKRSYKEIDAAGMIEHTPFVDTIRFDKFDPSKDGKVVLAYPEESARPFDGYRTGSDVLIGDTTNPSWNCMKTENVSKDPLWIFKSNERKLREEALEACNKKSLSDIRKLREEIASTSTGNMDQLLKVLMKVEKNLLDEQSEKLLTKMEDLENELGDIIDEDLADDNGVAKDNKKEAKSKAKKYAELLKTVEEEILPSYRGQLEALLERLENTEDEDEQNDIHDKIRDINEAVARFARDMGDGKESFRRAAKALKYYNLKTIAKKATEMNYYSALLGRVYKDSSDGRGSRITLSSIDSKVKKDVAKKVKRLFEIWDGEKDSRSGKKTAVLRQQQNIKYAQALKRKEQKAKYESFQLRSEYMNDWVKGYYKRYCQGWSVNYQKCSAAQQQIGTVRQQFGVSQRNAWSQFNQGLDAKYDPVIQRENQLLSHYTDLYRTGVLNARQRELEQVRLGNYRGISSGGISDSLGIWMSDTSSSDPGFLDLGLSPEMMMINESTTLGNPRSSSETMYFNPMLMNMPQ